MKEKFVLSIGFTQYLRDRGGMSKVIMEHQNLFNEAQVSYVHLFAVKKLMCRDRITLFSYFGMYIDGKYEGIFSAAQITQWLSDKFGQGHCLLDVHLHHMLYMKPENVKAILEALPEVSVKVFLHDYYLACSNYNLMKNGETFCGGRGLDKELCNGCKAYERSVETEQKLHAMLNSFVDRITFISPSFITKNIFLTFHPEYKEKVMVLPHQIPKLHYRENLDELKDGEKIRVAFMAMPRVHKGWQTWEKLVSRMRGKDYEFIVFNSSNEQYEDAEKVKIEFTEQNLNAMVEALRKKKVHIAFLWSICAETYSYTYFEALSSNCFVVTYKDSGNIADSVRRENTGCVFETEDEMLELFSSPEKVREMLNKYRRTTAGGPEYLEKNCEIVNLTLKEHGTTTARVKNKATNQLLIWGLEMLYKHGKV